jgi:xanthine dehydrogenase large subunit
MTKTRHSSAHTHVTGESIFIDDLPFLAGELHLAVVFSPVAHGRIKKIETGDAIKSEGVVGVFTGKDFVKNAWGSVIHDQPVLADEIVKYVGEPVAVVAAETPELARKARRLVRVEIEEAKPLFTIDEAIINESYIDTPKTIRRGDVEQALKTAPHVIEGVCETGPAEQFYLESQACIAYPSENGLIDILASSQHPTEVQHVVAETLGLPFHQVTCTVRRLGGAFGGKESQAAPFAAMAALVALRTKRPARLVLNKDEDMIATGKRHAFKCFYKVAFNGKGKIIGLNADLYANAGPYTDLSIAILERALLHADNAYHIPHAFIQGRICRTNIQSATAYRGFGAPQGIAMIESAIEDIAVFLKKDPLEIRRLNCYEGKEKTTPYGQEVQNNMLPKILDSLAKKAKYAKRRKDILAFNKGNPGFLKGISLVPVKFGIAFTTKFLNQGSALVNVHTDGTVQVSTGAVEMGQGVNTKIAQVVAQCFSIDPVLVRVMPTSTEKNHNTSPTAASSGADINGAAAMIACEEIKLRLSRMVAQKFALKGKKAKPGLEFDAEKKTDTKNIVFENGLVFDKRNKKIRLSWVDVVKGAWLNRIPLGAHGYYKTPNIFIDKETWRGSPFLYFTMGAAVSEVQIDRLTGETKVLRTDILMDLGRSINEEIDIGQITGAFMQGLGWVTTESLFYTSKGELVSHSPTTYKIPNIGDTPREFNVELIDNPYNTVNLLASKAVGEPPLVLCLSVWTAIRNAISSGSENDCRNISLPATPENILGFLS